MLAQLINRGPALVFVLAALVLGPTSRAMVPEGFSILADRSGVTSPITITPGQQTSPWTPSAADTARGFAAYPADSLANLTPEWAWTESAPTNKTVTFACPGQYKSAAVAVRTLRAVNQLQVICGNLNTADGNTILAENIDLRVVQYLPDEVDGKIFPGKGRWLEKSFPLDLPANWTAWVWVTFYIPENTPPGLYLGNLTVVDGSGATAVLPVRLTVLDFLLQRPPGSWGMLIPCHFYGPSVGIYENYALNDQWTPENLPLYFKFYKAHGFNSVNLVHVYPDLKCVNGQVVSYFRDARIFAHQMKASGMTGDLGIDLRWVEFWAGVASQRIIELRNQGLPPTGDLGIYGYNGSEDATLAFNDDAKDLFIQTVQQLKAMAAAEAWPQIRLMVEEELWIPTLKTQTYDFFMPVLLSIARDEAFLMDDAIGYPPYGGLYPIDRGERDNLPVRQYNNWTEQGLSDARQDGAQVRSYNMGCFRATWGLYQKRIGSTGHHQWADQWGQRAGRDTDEVWTNTRITPQGMVSSVEMERSREGLDDLAYFQTLELLATRLDQKGLTAGAANARAVLTNICSPVPLDRYEFFNWQAARSAAQLDQDRWQVVQAIQTARRELSEPVQAITTYANLCDDLTEWRDNSSGTMSIQTGGPSGKYIRFRTSITGSTITLHPTSDSGFPGVMVHAGDKLIFDVKGYAQDFSVNYTHNGTWTTLTGVPGNPWLYLDSLWHHFELTFSSDGLADNLCFNVYAPGQEVNLDNVMITPPALLPGDANNDRKVDVSDLGILAANYGVTDQAIWATGDFNWDHTVNVSDLGILAANYGTGTGQTLDFNQDAATLFASTQTTQDSQKTSSGCGSVGLFILAAMVGMAFSLAPLKSKNYR